jgi:hypothetical protein
MPDTLSLDCDFADRFVYWRGATGRRYIHTVYATADCPPLPGAVYVSVERDGRGHCRVLAVGRFPVHLAFNLARPADAGAGAALANEIHVHLLADGEDERAMIVDDLRRGLDIAPQPQRAGNASQLQLFAA